MAELKEFLEEHAIKWNTILSFKKTLYYHSKMFLRFYLLNPHQGSAMNALRNLQWLKTSTCILQ